MNESQAGQTADFVFTVTSSAPLGITLDFVANTQDGTATIGNGDYVALTNVPFSISGGASTASITVTVIGDNTFENNEIFYVDLSKFTGPASSDVTITNSTGVGTIINDDTLLLIGGYIYQAQGKQNLVIGTSSGVLSNANENLCCGTLTLVTPPKGTLTLMSDGSFTYNSNSFCSGQDSFVYQYTANGQTKTATAYIVVNNCPKDSHGAVYAFTYLPTYFAWNLTSPYTNQSLTLIVRNPTTGAISFQTPLAPGTTSYTLTASLAPIAAPYTVSVQYTKTTIQTIVPSPNTIDAQSNQSLYTAYKCCS